MTKDWDHPRPDAAPEGGLAKQGEGENGINRSVLRLPFEPGQWVDADEVMFQACFTILGEYVERELGREPWDFGDWSSTMYRGYRLHAGDIEEGDPSGFPPRPSPDREAIDLWLWYRDELPELEADYTRDICEVYGEGMQFSEPDENGLICATIRRTREPKYAHDYPETVKDQKLRALIDLRRSLWT